MRRAQALQAAEGRIGHVSAHDIKCLEKTSLDQLHESGHDFSRAEPHANSLWALATACFKQHFVSDSAFFSRYLRRAVTALRSLSRMRTVSSAPPGLANSFTLASQGSGRCGDLHPGLFSSLPPGACHSLYCASLSLVLALFTFAPHAVAQEEGFTEAAPSAMLAESQAATGAADGMVFAEGTRSINESRWNDAIGIFSQIAQKKSDHADGALYWKAYAENKLGRIGDALASCAALRAAYPKSSWIDDCGALEIDIGTRTGEPVHPDTEQSDDLKLLALNSLMQHDEASARAQIEQILNDEDASGKLKEGALFILGKKSADLTFPEIVRLSYVEGDVRVARGKDNEKATGATWEKAVADLPLETGYSLVTGAGRAEIELEDASTLYLAPNSVLSFSDLHTTNGVPYTDLALLSGTATVYVKPYLPDETFVLRTPSDDNLIAKYPGLSYIRVTSYVDATAISPLGGGVLLAPGVPDQSADGQTLFYRSSHRIEPPASAAAIPYVDWDTWVAQRIAHRSAAMNAVMKQAHLTSPLPGLAEMEGQGEFFDCAPYGTCWEPAAAEKFDEEADVETTGQPSPAAVSLDLHRGGAKLLFASMNAAGAREAPAGAQNSLEILEREEFFPCTPRSVRYNLVRDPATGRETLANSGSFAGSLPYAWGVCHAGYWVHRKHHYVWVVGKRHHHEPVRWIRSGRTIAYVPIHPRDLTGNVPINARNDVFAVSRKDGIFSIARVAMGPDHPVELLNSPPREFRSVYLRPLARSEEPKMEAHTIKDAAAGKTLVAGAGVPITFDRKSQSFTMPVHIMEGNRMVTLSKPIAARGGGASSSTHGGGMIGGAHSSSGGGATHAASGSSSGGGAHSGGGASAASSSSSSGGSHH